MLIEMKPVTAEKKLSILLGCREDEVITKLYEILLKEKENV